MPTDPESVERVFQVTASIVRQTGRCAGFDEIARQLPEMEAQGVLERVRELVGGGHLRNVLRGPGAKDLERSQLVVGRDVVGDIHDPHRRTTPPQQVIKAARDRKTTRRLQGDTDVVRSNRLARARTVLGSKLIEVDGAFRFDVALDLEGRAPLPVREVVGLACSAAFADSLPADRASLTKKVCDIDPMLLVDSGPDLLDRVFAHSRPVKE
jgi:hypothetical protein